VGRRVLLFGRYTTTLSLFRRLNSVEELTSLPGIICSPHSVGSKNPLATVKTDS
jgi:hypothetical protein